MSDVAKKYVKALASTMDDKTLQSVYESLSALVPAFKSKKFIAIVQGTDIDKAAKAKFLIDTVGAKDKKFENFLRLLAEKGRIGLIPQIVQELGSVIEQRTNTYHGRLISAEKVKSEAIKELEEVLSKKLGATIKLDNVVTDTSGMKVEVENLGVEIGISTDRIKQQITQTILSAI